MYNDYIPVIVFTIMAIALLIVPLIIQHLISPRHNKDNDKLMSYECGEVPEGSAWVKFNIRFYIHLLLIIPHFCSSKLVVNYNNIIISSIKEVV